MELNHYQSSINFRVCNLNTSNCCKHNCICSQPYVDHTLIIAAPATVEVVQITFVYGSILFKVPHMHHFVKPDPFSSVHHFSNHWNTLLSGKCLAHTFGTYKCQLKFIYLLWHSPNRLPSLPFPNTCLPLYVEMSRFQICSFIYF